MIPIKATDILKKFTSIQKLSECEIAINKDSLVHHLKSSGAVQCIAFCTPFQQKHENISCLPYF